MKPHLPGLDAATDLTDKIKVLMVSRPTFEVMKALSKEQMETVAFVLRLPQDKGQQYSPSDILAHLTIQRGRFQPGTA
jgi:hypothetical protein